ncbi:MULTISPECIES: hypothetical protein [unclassified Sphingopyxis]|uniref:hypothetical protein n=1 Tax=unclassified Sphingopyxis TaxID=2614943 RepID=UPI0028562FFA|nr:MULTISPECIES: hypothetical protein [unclassified Sphingopyxis]MDR7060248.1 hypothetical protein [Sphingopyxis sp. BE235]MDR7180239.1 hypothetical protein [Sphingopyxis sp. BE249]
MPALLSTFDSRALSQVTVAIDGCDTEIGAGLAMVLAELGAHVRLYGADRAAIESLCTSITGHWGRAEPATGNGPAHDVAIRIFVSTAEATDHVRAASPDDRARTILVVANAQPDSEDLEAALAARDPGRTVHAILASAEGDDPGSLAALVTFLLSPAGSAIPSQCFTLHGGGQTSRDALYPATPVCMPAIAPMR